jgi:flagellar biogenesis protein FliO
MTSVRKKSVLLAAAVLVAAGLQARADSAPATGFGEPPFGSAFGSEAQARGEPQDRGQGRAAARNLEAERVSVSASGPASTSENRLLRKDGPGLLEGWWQTAAALAIVLAAILALRWALKRFGKGAAASRVAPMDVLARSTVGPRQQLLLVRLGAKLILVGSSPAGLRSLHVVSEPEEVAMLTEAAIGDAAALRGPPLGGAALAAEPPAENAKGEGK